MSEKRTYFVSLQLGLLADQPYDHTYQFEIEATDIEATLLQEKLDKMADGEVWFGILNLVQDEDYSNDRRHESEHLLKEIYEMIAALEKKTGEKHVADDSLTVPHREPSDPTTPAHLAEKLD